MHLPPRQEPVTDSSKYTAADVRVVSWLQLYLEIFIFFTDLKAHLFKKSCVFRLIRSYASVTFVEHF